MKKSKQLSFDIDVHEAASLIDKSYKRDQKMSSSFKSRIEPFSKSSFTRGARWAFAYLMNNKVDGKE